MAQQSQDVESQDSINTPVVVVSKRKLFSKLFKHRTIILLVIVGLLVLVAIVFAVIKLPGKSTPQTKGKPLTHVSQTKTITSGGKVIKQTITKYSNGTAKIQSQTITPAPKSTAPTPIKETNKPVITG